MAPFLRIAFNEFNLGDLPPMTEQPFCAIKMKESLSTGQCGFQTEHNAFCKVKFTLGLSSQDLQNAVLP